MNNKQFKTPKGTEFPLLNLRGSDYLEVKYRIAWFREDHPDWSIKTSFLHTDDVSSLARAEIINKEGVTLSTGHKQESKAHFLDHAEKSESGAVGRALAMLGYGTVNAQEFEEATRIVDSPVKPTNTKPVEEFLDFVGVDTKQTNKPVVKKGGKFEI